MTEIHITREMLRSMDNNHPLSARVDAIQANITAYKQLFIGLPQITLHETDDIIWCVNTLDVPENYVYKTRLTAENVDQRLGEILQQISQHTTHIDWPVYRTCTPANLEQKLLERGFTLSRLPWFLAELAAVPHSLPVAATFHSERVTDATQLALWRDLSAAGFEMDNAQIFYDAYSRHGFDADSQVQHYIGYLGAEPVTSATLLLAGGDYRGL